MSDLYLPNGREDELRKIILRDAWDYVKWSNCLDKQLAAFLVKEGRIIGRGWNLCAPPPYNYGDKLSVCLRKDAPRGTHREKCRGFHAEIFACLSVTRRGITAKDYGRFAWYQFDGEKGEVTRRVLQRRFSPEDRERIAGAELYLVGIAYVCDVCQWLLDWLGVVIHEDNILPKLPATADFERRRTFDQ